MERRSRALLVGLAVLARAGETPTCGKAKAYSAKQVTFINTLDKGPLPDQPAPASPPLAVLIPWTGPAPTAATFPWLEYWFASVQANARFADWIVLTEPGNGGVFDALAPRATNLRVVETRMQPVYDRALGFKVPINRQSIKGMKVALGAVWRSLTARYAFWAWSDLDVVYGDLARHLALPLADARTSVVTLMPQAAHWCGVKAVFAGQFTIFRNDERTRNLFRRIKGWQGEIRSAKFTRLDEIGIAQAAVGDRPAEVAFVQSQLTQQDLDKKPGDAMYDVAAAWIDGRLVLLARDGDARVASEAALLHLSILKTKVNKPKYPDYATWRSAPDARTLNRTGFLMPLLYSKPWRALTDAERDALRTQLAQPASRSRRRRLRNDTTTGEEGGCSEGEGDGCLTNDDEESHHDEDDEKKARGEAARSADSAHRLVALAL